MGKCGRGTILIYYKNPRQFFAQNYKTPLVGAEVDEVGDSVPAIVIDTDCRIRRAVATPVVAYHHDWWGLVWLVDLRVDRDPKELYGKKEAPKELRLSEMHPDVLLTVHETDGIVTHIGKVNSEKEMLYQVASVLRWLGAVPKIERFEYYLRRTWALIDIDGEKFIIE